MNLQKDEQVLVELKKKTDLITKATHEKIRSLLNSRAVYQKIERKTWISRWVMGGLIQNSGNSKKIDIFNMGCTIKKAKFKN